MRSQRRLVSPQLGEVSTEITPDTNFVLEKSLNLNTKFGIKTIWAMRFSSDYQYLILATLTSTFSNYVLNVVDINDIDTWTLKESFSGGGNRGIELKKDGTKFYFGYGTLYQYSLSTPYLMSNKTLDTSLATPWFERVVGVKMNPTGTKLFLYISVVRNTYHNLFREYSLTTPWDIAERTLVQEKILPPISSSESAMVFINNGNAILSVSEYDFLIRTVSSPYTLNDLSSRELVSSTIRNNAVEINQDQRKVYTMDYSAGETLYQFSY